MNARTIRSTLIGSLGVALALASGCALATSFRLTDLGTVGGTGSRGSAINASGQVTGFSDTTDGLTHAFVWDGTTTQDLGTLGGLNGIGNAINASGKVTGSASTAPGDDVFHAFLWDGTTVQDLNALIDPADPLQPFVTLVSGVDINDLGQILANGFDSRTGEGQAYLVSPVPLTVPDPRAQLEALVEVVLSLNLKAGIGNALDSKLQNALAALDRVHQQDNGSTVGILYAFIQSIEAQRGKALTTEQADQLVSAAQGVIDAL